MTPHAPILSVVVPTFDHERWLSAFLDGLQAGGLAPEVLVVDGGSVDWTREIAAGRGVRVLFEKGGEEAQVAAGTVAASCREPLVVNPGTMTPRIALALVRRAAGRAARRDRATVPAWIGRGTEGVRPVRVLAGMLRRGSQFASTFRAWPG